MKRLSVFRSLSAVSRVKLRGEKALIHPAMAKAVRKIVERNRVSIDDLNENELARNPNKKRMSFSSIVRIPVVVRFVAAYMSLAY